MCCPLGMCKAVQILAVGEVHVLQGLFASCCRRKVQGPALVLCLIAHATRWQPMHNDSLKGLRV